MHPTPNGSNTLGTYTKSIHAPAAPRRLDPERAARKAGANAHRHRLQRIAQGLLWVKGQDWREQHRTCWCSRSLKRGSASVTVRRNVDGSGASLAGLNRCGEVWTCPTCAARIAEQRRDELSRAMAAHVGAGGAAYLVTLTTPHESTDDLGELLAGLAKARQQLQNCRAWKREWTAAGRIGSVASLEITWSEQNGWHPHVHMLVFADARGLGDSDPIDDAGELDSDAIRTLRREWVNRLIKIGMAPAAKLNDMMSHAFSVRGGTQAAEYVAKFGRDERHGSSAEMTAVYGKVGAVKRAGLVHSTPFQLLEWAGNGDATAAAKFAEYARTVAGRRALTWSPGLKKSLGIAELTDEEIAADDARRPEQEEVGELEQLQYQDILRRDMLPNFLEYVASAASCQADLDEYVDAIRQHYTPTRSGAVIIRGAFAGRHMVH